jgi:hypothetical protein
MPHGCACAYLRSHNSTLVRCPVKSENKLLPLLVTEPPPLTLRLRLGIARPYCKPANVHRLTQTARQLTKGLAVASESPVLTSPCYAWFQ